MVDRSVSELNVRYVRWQGLAIAQLSVAVALVSALSVAGLGAGLALLQNSDFMFALHRKWLLATALVLLVVAAAFSCVTVVARTLDFRLTARKVRKDQDPSYSRALTFLCASPEFYGRVSWGCFWVSLLSFFGGALALVASVGTAYAKCLQ